MTGGSAQTPDLDMCTTCDHSWHMSKMIQLRNVPDSIHRQLKARAALEGLSLSDFLTREAQRIVARPSLEEMRERLAARPITILKRSPTSVVREERDRR